MSEEEKGAALEAAQTEEPQEPQVESQSVPESEAMPEDALKTYEGKSPEELAKMHYSASKKLGEQGQVIGSLKELVDELRAAREKKDEIPNPFQIQQQQTQEVAPPVSPEEQLADDDYATVGVIKKLLGKKDEESRQYQYQNLLQKTSIAFDKGRASMEGNKRLYDGIENEVAQRVAQSYIMPFKAFGMDVSDELQNPDRWKEAAIYIRAQRGEYDRLVPDKTQPVAATMTDTPSSIRPSGGSPPVEVDMNDRGMTDFMDAMEDATGKRPTQKEIEETVKRGAEVWKGDISLDEINRGNR